MVECESEGCTRKAEHTVEFESPDEELAYCGPCGRAKYYNEPKAVAISKGVEDDEE